MTNSDDRDFVQQATQMTAANLRRLTTEVNKDPTTTSQLSIPEREELIQLVSEILPAGNVVGFVFNGVRSVKGRGVSSDEGRTHLNSLFKGLSIVRDNAFYRMMFAGPATVLTGYNMLLRLAGADPDQFLPDGAWQFYVEFGLREDTARHSNETLGFQQAVKQLSRSVTDVDLLSAWILAAMWLLRDYDDLLAMAWEERVRMQAIEEATGLPRLHRAWEMIRPFDFPEGFSDLVSYRRFCFNQFCEQQLHLVGADQRRKFLESWDAPQRRSERTVAIRRFCQQMTLHSYLDPGEYSEQRVSVRKSDVSVGVVYKGAYFLVSFVDPANPAAYALIRGQVKAILECETRGSELDLFLVSLPRFRQAELRGLLSNAQKLAIQRLRSAPIIINWDRSRRRDTLSAIRQERRGIGDHALTVFSTDESMVFDFSHIYFDGPWAMEISEMLTRQAAWYLRNGGVGGASTKSLVTVVDLVLEDRFRKVARNLSRVVDGVSAEASFDIKPVLDLRRLLTRKLKPPVQLTVNDLLVLYRTVFNQCYFVDRRVHASLQVLRNEGLGRLVDSVESMFLSLRDANPSLLIPVDASRVDPKARLFPCTFRSPFVDLLGQHREVLGLLKSVAEKQSYRDDGYRFFNKSRVAYLGVLSVFGEVMRRYRAIAVDGQSMSTSAIRLVAGLPGAMQRLVDGLPGRFAFMNEAIKGEEVFSNVGRVTVGSSISRFSSAKDDNDKKVLVWGVMTDDNDRLCITLRDFRPPVLALVSAGHSDVAHAVSQDFLNAYVAGFLVFISELKSIILFSGS